MRDACAVLVALSSLLGCGGAGGGGARTPSQPTAVATPTPTPVPSPAARDGLSGEAVAAEFAPVAPAVGENVSARAAGYLLREQRFDGTPMFLWPSDEDYVRTLVYSTRFTDDSYRMIRWASPITLSLESGLDADAAVLDRVVAMADYVGRLLEFPVSVGAGGNVQIRIDAHENEALGTVAFVTRRYQGATIVGAEMVFANRAEILGSRGSDYRSTLLHEMGHVLGVGHSPIDRDVMRPGGSATPGGKAAEFQPDETRCFLMMYRHRRAGNFPPDRDPGVTSAAARGAWSDRILD